VCPGSSNHTYSDSSWYNRYNISINYKLRSLQNDPWVRKNITSEWWQKSKRG
jgi:hypothetical protein